MVRIAVLSEQVSSQIRTANVDRPRELENVQVVWSGTSGDELRRRGKALRPQVLVVEMALLGEGPAVRHELDELLASTEAELALVLYTFTRREHVQQLNSTRSRALKAPISLATLRLNMLSLLVKDALRTNAAEPEPRSPSAAPAAQPVRPESEMPEPPARKNPAALAPVDSSAEPLPGASQPRLFSQAQLGRLQEIKSAVRCECPSHLSELVTSLAAFEEYSRSCENRDVEDAKLHAHLYRQTSRARRVMEEALLALCQYEKIEL
ncbi:MAG TPA: hypothetical protein PLW65_23465 [Pseudomonadota bacterium]|nr:hypothetical protein [Pseudomonadota bacterium]